MEQRGLRAESLWTRWVAVNVPAGLAWAVGLSPRRPPRSALPGPPWPPAWRSARWGLFPAPGPGRGGLCRLAAPVSAASGAVVLPCVTRPCSPGRTARPPRHTRGNAPGALRLPWQLRGCRRPLAAWRRPSEAEALPPSGRSRETRTGWAGLGPGRGRDGRSGRDRAADGVPADPRADRRTRAHTGPHGALRRTGAESGRKGPGQRGRPRQALTFAYGGWMGG
jgi:hypothetical protein